MTTVLVVEDDATIRTLLARWLMREGYVIIAVGDGMQAVTQAQTEAPDLIVMDIGLPVLNGWQATHRLKSNPATAAIPIIALTAYTMPEEKLKCLSVGCDDYETKPVEFTRLLAKIHALTHTGTDRTRRMR